MVLVLAPTVLIPTIQVVTIVQETTEELRIAVASAAEVTEDSAVEAAVVAVATSADIGKMNQNYRKLNITENIYTQ